MKYLYLIGILFLGLKTKAQSQDYPFKKNYSSGFIILKNSTRVNGNIKWMPDQINKLRFTKNVNNTSPDKYAPQDLLGFQVDSFRFVSLFNFPVYAEKYEWLGDVTYIKSDFAQVLDSGHYTIYLVVTSGFNQNNDLQYYNNYVFQRKTASGFEYAAYPLGKTSVEKKYELVKSNLIKFFTDYPEIVEKIKGTHQHDDFTSTIALMKMLNN